MTALTPVPVLYNCHGFVSSGIEAKILVQDGKVEVNGETDTRRGRKLYPGDVFEYNGQKVSVTGE